jgi:hypothetical protein
VNPYSVPVAHDNNLPKTNGSDLKSAVENSMTNSSAVPNNHPTNDRETQTPIYAFDEELPAEKFFIELSSMTKDRSKLPVVRSLVPDFDSFFKDCIFKGRSCRDPK